MNKWGRVIFLVAAMAMLGCANLMDAQDTQEDEKVVLKSGDIPPDFTLNDQDGNEIKLSELTGDHNLAIVFVRSVDW